MTSDTSVRDAVSSGKRSVLVLGGGGFIGRRIVTRLTSRGQSVHPASFDRIDLCAAGDVRQLALRIMPATALVMCAVIRRTVDDSFEAMVRNIEMVDNVLRSFAGLPLGQIVFLSSVDVYGRPPQVLPVDERSAIRPTSYYGVGKVACELLFNLVDPATVPVTILRLPGVYGITDGGRSVIGTFLHRTSSGQVVHVTGDGSTVRDYVHVDDVATLVEACLADVHTGVFNVVTGRAVAIRDIVHEAGEALGRTPNVEFAPTASTAGDAIFDASKVRAAWPGVRFRRVEEGIRQYAAEMGD
jgi:UDP-glucose 4-epimerase